MQYLRYKALLGRFSHLKGIYPAEGRSRQRECLGQILGIDKAAFSDPYLTLILTLKPTTQSNTKRIMIRYKWRKH